MITGDKKFTSLQTHFTSEFEGKKEALLSSKCGGKVKEKSKIFDYGGT